MTVVCCHVEVSVMSWSLIQRSPINCVASLCVIYKPQEWGDHDPHQAAVPQDKTIHKPSSDKEMFKNSMSMIYFVNTKKDSWSSKYMLWTYKKIFNNLNFNKKHVRNWEHKQKHTCLGWNMIIKINKRICIYYKEKCNPKL